MGTMRELLEQAEMEASPYGRDCPYCGAPIEGTCRCALQARPHTLDQLRRGHGDLCANRHRSEPLTGLVIDAETGAQLAP